MGEFMTELAAFRKERETLLDANSTDAALDRDLRARSLKAPQSRLI